LAIFAFGFGKNRAGEQVIVESRTRKDISANLRSTALLFTCSKGDFKNAFYASKPRSLSEIWRLGCQIRGFVLTCGRQISMIKQVGNDND
jgi:hypothetical protein